MIQGTGSIEPVLFFVRRQRAFLIEENARRSDKLAHVLVRKMDPLFEHMFRATAPIAPRALRHKRNQARFY